MKGFEHEVKSSNPHHSGLELFHYSTGGKLYTGVTERMNGVHPSQLSRI